MKEKIDKSKIVEKYNSVYGQYEKLGLNLSQVFELLLNENDIQFLSVYYRVKDIDSFIKKIEQKGYQDPFKEIEDICGVRIICYYQSDVELIKKILRKELNVLEDENKEENLEFDQFGYRSTHLILTTPDKWLETPNYRGLKNVKAEVQVRTVLMHAWAEIAHKLAYKSKSQIPKAFRRKLSRISAKLEESDEQFEEIKKQIESNKKELIISAEESNEFNPNVEFNLDSLQAFLDYAFPNRKKSIELTSGLFEEMEKKKISLKDLIFGYKKAGPFLRDVEKETAWDKENGFYLVQVGAARMILDLTIDSYFLDRKDFLKTEILTKYREKINKEKK
ncbi:GTP pyrophosphokinase [Rhodohalobacter sp. 614A]|uniref:GTP pyrophosphokinase n=1 Tax=Rhodohalobacter sp. 614A TaxID=2908649 RepID=UPI001F37ECDB|nr:hypothetical protein [Rhodohalobacter sp. 614A]